MANPTGRHNFLTPEQIEDMREMARRGVPVYKIAAHYDVSPNTARYHVTKQQRSAARAAAERTTP